MMLDKETYKDKVTELENCFREWYERTHDDKKINLDIEGFGKVILNPAGGVYMTGTEVTLTAESFSRMDF